MKKNLQLDKEIGQRIKECRLAEGHSQTNLADVLGFDSPTAISLIESGDRSLQIRDLIILCQLFQKDYNYFLGHPSEHRHKKL